jgi:hypothetical protein
MFERLTPLSAERHRELRVTPVRSYAFARGMDSCPVMAAEAARVARDHVLVFGAPGSLPLAVVALNPGDNAYVDEAGRWRARYVPAHLRRYPFAAVPVRLPDHGAEGWALGLVEDAPQLSCAQGHHLFTPEGQPTPTLDYIRRELEALRVEEQATLQAVAQLQACGLLLPQGLAVRAPDGSTQAVHGYRVVSMERMAALPAAALAALRDSGALALAYAHQVSLANLRDGVLSQARAAALHKPALPGGHAWAEVDELDASVDFGALGGA